MKFHFGHKSLYLKSRLYVKSRDFTIGFYTFFLRRQRSSGQVPIDALRFMMMIVVVMVMVMMGIIFLNYLAPPTYSGFYMISI